MDPFRSVSRAVYLSPRQCARSGFQARVRLHYRMRDDTMRSSSAPRAPVSTVFEGPTKELAQLIRCAPSIRRSVWRAAGDIADRRDPPRDPLIPVNVGCPPFEGGRRVHGAEPFSALRFLQSGAAERRRVVADRPPLPPRRFFARTQTRAQSGELALRRGVGPGDS